MVELRPLDGPSQNTGRPKQRPAECETGRLQKLRVTGVVGGEFLASLGLAAAHLWHQNDLGGNHWHFWSSTDFSQHHATKKPGGHSRPLSRPDPAICSVPGEVIGETGLYRQ